MRCSPSVNMLSLLGSERCLGLARTSSLDWESCVIQLFRDSDTWAACITQIEMSQIGKWYLCCSFPPLRTSLQPSSSGERGVTAPSVCLLASPSSRWARHNPDLTGRCCVFYEAAHIDAGRVFWAEHTRVQKTRHVRGMWSSSSRPVLLREFVLVSWGEEEQQFAPFSWMQKDIPSLELHKRAFFKLVDCRACNNCAGVAPPTWGHVLKVPHIVSAVACFVPAELSVLWINQGKQSCWKTTPPSLPPPVWPIPRSNL